MSKRTVILTICDCCSKELTGRLTFHTCPCCGFDICVACQEKENARHKPRERKPKVVPTENEVETSEVPTPPATGTETAVPKPKKRGKRVEPEKTEEEPEIADKKGENPTDLISTFSVSVGQGDEPHIATLGTRTERAKTLKECALKLLAYCGIDEKFVEDSPDSEGKRNLLKILKGGEK